MLTRLLKVFKIKFWNFLIEDFFYLPPVSTTRWCTLSCEYLREFSKKFETVHKEYSGARGNGFMEKTWSRKSRDSVPLSNAMVFKCVSIIPYLWLVYNWSVCSNLVLTAHVKYRNSQVSSNILITFIILSIFWSQLYTYMTVNTVNFGAFTFAKSGYIYVWCIIYGERRVSLFASNQFHYTVK